MYTKDSICKLLQSKDDETILAEFNKVTLEFKIMPVYTEYAWRCNNAQRSITAPRIVYIFGEGGHEGLQVASSLYMVDFTAVGALLTKPDKGK